MSEKIDNIDELESKMLTTTDNPFNPKTHYDSWRTWDESSGYYTEAYIARVADIPIDADTEDDALIEQYLTKAIESILENDETGLYVLV